MPYPWETKVRVAFQKSKNDHEDFYINIWIINVIY